MQVFEDLFDYMNSLQKILSVKPDLIYPAHGALVKNPVEHVTYYINHRNQREAQIIAVLTEQSSISLTPMELVKFIYVVCMCVLAPHVSLGSQMFILCSMPI